MTLVVVVRIPPAHCREAKVSIIDTADHRAITATTKQLILKQSSTYACSKTDLEGGGTSSKEGGSIETSHPPLRTRNGSGVHGEQELLRQVLKQTRKCGVHEDDRVAFGTCR